MRSSHMLFAAALVSLVAATQARPPRSATADDAKANADRMFAEGKRTFRDDTFGSEAFWGGTLQLHRAILGQAQGGVGAGLSPKAALGLGLKVDAERVPPAA